MLRPLLLLTVALSAVQAAAQQLQPQIRLQAEQAGTAGSVTGRVVCSDTQHAARFANVLLIPVEEATGDARERGGSGRRSGARTDLEGNFTATNVQAGDYYVSANATGYVSEAALIVAAGNDPASALSHLPTVHVSAGSSSTVNVSLERGSTIAGRVQWDDGTPATGVQINAISATATPQGNGRSFGFFGPGGDFAQTDDRGQFRLTGLAPGSYLIRSNVQTPAPSDGSGRGFGGRTTTVAMYAPGKVRRADAQTITLRAGEERGDIQMTMDLASLHRVTGHIGAASGTVASGTVRLTDTQDSSLTRTASINADGSYLLGYVPAGNYSLSVPFASSNPAQMGRTRGGDTTTPGATFQPFQETVTVADGDLTGVDVTLTPAAQVSK